MKLAGKNPLRSSLSALLKTLLRKSGKSPERDDGETPGGNRKTNCEIIHRSANRATVSPLSQSPSPRKDMKVLPCSSASQGFQTSEIPFILDVVDDLGHFERFKLDFFELLLPMQLLPFGLAFLLGSL